MKLTNGNARVAMLIVGAITISLMVLSGSVYLSATDSTQERTAIFIAAIGTLLAPTVGALLNIAQGKEIAEQVEAVHVQTTATKAAVTSIPEIVKENVEARDDVRDAGTKVATK